MSEYQKTDVCITADNFPFITLTESKVPNVWYHDSMDFLFSHTSKGFKHIKGSKKILEGNELTRNST